MAVSATGAWKFIAFRQRIATPYGPADGVFGTSMHATGDLSGGNVICTATSAKPVDWAGRLLILDHITAIVDSGGSPDIEWYFSLGAVENHGGGGQLLPTAPNVRASLRGLDDSVKGRILWPGMPATQASILFSLEFATNTNAADYYAGFEGYYRSISPGAFSPAGPIGEGGRGTGGGRVSLQ